MQYLFFYIYYSFTGNSPNLEEIFFFFGFSKKWTISSDISIKVNLFVKFKFIKFHPSTRAFMAKLFSLFRRASSPREIPQTTWSTLRIRLHGTSKSIAIVLQHPDSTTVADLIEHLQHMYATSSVQDRSLQFDWITNPPILCIWSAAAAAANIDVLLLPSDKRLLSSLGIFKCAMLDIRRSDVN